MYAQVVLGPSCYLTHYVRLIRVCIALPLFPFVLFVVFHRPPLLRGLKQLA